MWNKPADIELHTLLNCPIEDTGMTTVFYNGSLGGVLWLMFEVGVQWLMVVGLGYCSEVLRLLKDMVMVHGLV